MTANSDFKNMKEKKIDKETTLKITQHRMTGRIFVEYKSINPSLTLQKNFQDTYDGRAQSDEFAKKYNTTKELRAHFGIKE